MSLKKLQAEAKKGGWYNLKKEKKKKNASSGNASMQTDFDLSSLGSLCTRLTEKFAVAVEQLGSDGDDIDTNRLRHLVAVMKDLTTLKQNAENEEKQPEKNQEELIDVIRRAVEAENQDLNLVQDNFENGDEFFEKAVT